MCKLFSIQSKITRHAKKQKNITHNQRKKNQSIETPRNDRHFNKVITNICLNIRKTMNIMIEMENIKNVNRNSRDE